MPPRRATRRAAAAPATPPLQDCVVVCSGTFPGLSQAELMSKVAGAGGLTANSITKKATHLIASQADYDKPSAKVKKAQEFDVHIISLDWLEDCITYSTHEPETKYALGAANGTTASAAAPASSTGTAGAPPAKQAAPASASAVRKGSKKRQAPPSASPDPANGGGASDAEEAKPTKKKKKLAETKEDEESKFGEGQIAKAGNIQVPLDVGCPHVSYKVYIDPADGVIWDAALNQTNSTANNNKFYRIQLLVNASGSHFQTWTRWGRVGDYGQRATLGDGSIQDAKRNFEKKFKDKSGLKWENRTDPPARGKYTFVERSYAEDSDSDSEEDEKSAAGEGKTKGVKPPESKLPVPVQSLMQLIFNQQYLANNMSALNYDTNKMPLGKLSRATILKGFQTLKDLSALIDDNSLVAQYDAPYATAVEGLSNAYFSLIPHAFGRNRPPVISDQNMVKKEIELLENLADMKDAVEIMKAQIASKGDTAHPLDKQYSGLGMEEMTPLDRDSTEFKNLAEYLIETRGQTHSVQYGVQDIFRIERQGERDRFEKSAFSGPPKDRRLLWHGSRATNFGGILSQGLRIAPPEAPVSGYMFDKGIYLADMSSKSANYCCSYITGGNALLLLCEAELGTPMQELTGARSNAATTAKQNKMWSTWGQGTMAPTKWKDASCVHPSLKGVSMPDTTTEKPGHTGVAGAGLLYNEYICYDVSQVRLRYLFRVQMK